MPNITADMVKELRERSGAGMMDCKKALVETNGDMEAALDYLKEKGLSKPQEGWKNRAEGRGRLRTWAGGLVSWW